MPTAFPLAHRRLQETLRACIKLTESPSFGGGLPLYGGSSIIGGLGVFGETSCDDHNIAWRVRQLLGLDRVPAGVTGENNDAIIYDLGMIGKNSSGYRHPTTRLKEDSIAKEIGAGAEGK